MVFPTDTDVSASVVTVRMQKKQHASITMSVLTAMVDANKFVKTSMVVTVVDVKTALKMYLKGKY